MILTLYDQTGQEKAVLSPNDSSTQTKEVQGDNVLNLSFTLYEYVPIDVNDYVEFCGERYWAVERYLPQEKSTVEWVYNVQLYGIESLIKRFLVLKTVDGDAEAVFSLTESPLEHVRLIVGCINAGMGTTDWRVGTVEGTGNVAIDYEGKYCDEALKELAEAVGTEWWIEGETVNLCRCEHGEELTLGYGNGLTGLDRDVADGAKFYTRLFPIGSSRNIDAGEYGHSRLQLPNGAKWVDVNVEKYGIVHHYEQEAFSGIYPRRVGRVSSVRSEEVTGEDGNPFTIWYFRDDSLTFDPNDYEIGGLVKHVSFQEGSELAGLGDADHSFEVNFDSESGEFEIITIWPYDDDMQLPGGRLVPEVGDEYILWNIRMPNEYYGLAEQELRQAVDAYNEEHALDVSVYKGQTDHVWVEEMAAAVPQQTGQVLYVGRRVRLESEEYFPETGYRQSRVTRISRRVNLPSLMDLEISDALSRKAMERIDDAIGGVKHYTDARLGQLDVPNLIKSWESTLPTDNNVFSARRVVKQFLDKLTTAWQHVAGSVGFGGDVEVGGNVEVGGDMAVEGSTELNGNSRSVGNMTFGPSSREDERCYEEGVKGARIWWNGNGWMVETDYLGVNKRMYAKSVQVDETTHVGGESLLTGAQCVADAVREYETFYRVFFRKKNGEGRTIYNQFRTGDQAYCQIFNVDAGLGGEFTNRYYWRLVVNTSNNASAIYDEETVAMMEEYHFIDLSKSDCDMAGVMRMDASGGNVPMADDPIVQFGYRRQAGDDDALVTERQGATLISGAGKYRRAIMMWEGVDSYVLPSPRVRLSPSGVKLIADEFYLRTNGRTTDIKDYMGVYMVECSTALVSTGSIGNAVPVVLGGEMASMLYSVQFGEYLLKMAEEAEGSSALVKCRPVFQGAQEKRYLTDGVLVAQNMLGSKVVSTIGTSSTGELTFQYSDIDPTCDRVRITYTVDGQEMAVASIGIVKDGRDGVDAKFYELEDTGSSARVAFTDTVVSGTGYSTVLTLNLRVKAQVMLVEGDTRERVTDLSPFTLVMDYNYNGRAYEDMIPGTSGRYDWQPSSPVTLSASLINTLSKNVNISLLYGGNVVASFTCPIVLDEDSVYVRTRTLMESMYASGGDMSVVRQAANSVAAKVAKLGSQFLPTGWDVEHLQMVFTANNLICRNNNGERTAWLDELGNWTTKGIQSQLRQKVEDVASLLNLFVPFASTDFFDGNYADDYSSAEAVGDCVYNENLRIGDSIISGENVRTTGIAAMTNISGWVQPGADSHHSNFLLSLDVRSAGGLIEVAYMPSHCSNIGGGVNVTVPTIVLPYLKVNGWDSVENDWATEFVRTPTRMTTGDVHYIDFDELKSMIGRRITIVNAINQVLLIAVDCSSQSGFVYLPKGNAVVLEFNAYEHGSTTIVDGGGRTYKISHPWYGWEIVEEGAYYEMTESTDTNYWNNKTIKEQIQEG